MTTKSKQSKQIVQKATAFATQLISLLETHHVTQSQLAHHLGVGPSTVSSWVNGAIPHRRTAKAVAETFGVMTDWLFYAVEPKYAPGRTEGQIPTLGISRQFDRPLPERSSWPQPVGLDGPALKELAAKLDEAARALGSCAKIIAKSAGHKRGRKRKRSS